MRVAAALLCLLALSCSKPSSAQTLSPSAFRDVVASEIAKRYPTLCIEKPNASSIHVGRTRQACNDAVVNTAFIYQQYVNDPTKLQVYVAALTSVAFAALDSVDRPQSTRLDRARLVAVIRPKAYAESLRSNEGKVGGLWRPFVGDLIAILVQRDGAISRSLTADEVKALNLTEAEAWELALHNVRAKIGSLARSANSQGAETVTAESGLAVSNLWLPEACSRAGANFDVFVVSRDTYFYADQRNPAATSTLAGYVAELLKSGQETYSDNLLSCIDGRWYASVFDGGNTWRPATNGDH